MNENWYPGIRAFCKYWHHASMLQQTFDTLEKEFAAGNDSCIDAAKGLVECACRVLLEELDDPTAPFLPIKSGISFTGLLGLTTQKLKIDKVRDKAFANLIKEHNKLADALRALRNEAGTVSHGKNGFLEKLSVHHRRAAILAADAIVTFLHEAYLEREPDISLTLEPYERFSLSNDIIDKYTAVIADNIEDDFQDGLLRIRVLLPNNDEIPLAIKPSLLLFCIDREAYKQTLNACREEEEIV